MQQDDPQAKNNQQQWYFASKIVLTYCENFLRSLEQFIRTGKGRYNFWNKIIFKLVPEGFSDLIHYNN